MKAEELRIGNIVLNVLNQPIRVDWENIKWANDVNPIPLTPEILEKLGFKWETQERKHLQLDLPEQGINKRNISFLYLEGECKMLQYYMDDYFGGYFETIPPQFLHQFQNLYFALTGEELTVNL